MRDRFGADVTWLPFDLHPEYPSEGIPRAQLLARYGSSGDDPMRSRFEAAGLAYNPPPDVVPNTRLAHRVNGLARERDLGEQLHDRLMDAYWAEARNIGDADVLRELAADVGLDGVDAAMADDAYDKRLLDSTAQAHAIGVSGVPAFLLDGRLLVLGAQPRPVFERAYEQLETAE